MSASDNSIAMPIIHINTPAITSILISSDGACSGNPGPMGYGAIVQFLAEEQVLQELEISGGGRQGTNNLAELTAAIEAISAIREATLATVGTPIVLQCDSKQVTMAMSEWLPNWKRNGWKKSGGKRGIENKDLYVRLDFLTHDLDITYQWVKGHAGNTLNERADALARKGMEPFLLRAAA